MTKERIKEIQNGIVNLKAEAEERLEYLRGEIVAERISTSEICELQFLKEHIPKNKKQTFKSLQFVEQT